METEAVEEVIDVAPVVEVESSPEEVVESADPNPENSQTEEEKTPAPEWVKELRRSHRELQKRNRDLERLIESKREPEKPLPPKPKLSDFDYVVEKFEPALDDWYSQKRIYEEAEVRKNAEQKTVQERWQQRVNSYTKQREDFLGKHEDYDVSETLVQEILSADQQGIIVQGAKNSALVVYALGKNPSKAREFAKISDPVEFAFTVAQYESSLRGARPTPPPPEKSLTSSKAAASSDSTLDKLRKEAERTGDYTKVHRYKISLRQRK